LISNQIQRFCKKNVLCPFRTKRVSFKQ
jgi:hypothetical protein